VAKNTNDLPPDEAYVVTNLRTVDPLIRPDPNGRALLWCGHLAVCTFDTLFRMLGRGVLMLDPAAPRADRYQLTPEWKPDA
jgi:hypothetical protein